MQALSETLEFALALKRPYGGKGVAALAEYLLDLPNAFLDDFGNVHVPVGASKTMFSCHIDTVHSEDGVNQFKVIFDIGEEGAARVSRYRARSSCLGADCAAGVALMVHMIMSGIAGYYIFHDGEELGCLGSRFLAQETNFVQQFHRAIAFDRKGNNAIITHQSGMQTATESFASSLKGEFQRNGLVFRADDTGSRTDTLEYRKLIRECTNISVGYHFAHTPKEWLDFAFLEKFAKTCVSVNWEKLTSSRRWCASNLEGDKWLAADIEEPDNHSACFVRW